MSLVEKKFGDNKGAADAATFLFDQALYGYPIINPLKSGVYLLAKDIIRDSFGINSDERIVLYISIWRSMLNTNRAEPLNFNMDQDRKEDLERMKSFFNVLCARGQREERSIIDPDDDE